MKGINVSNVINANEAYLDHREKLIDLYIEDYGVKNKDEIIKRLDKTFYMFESKPSLTKKLLECNNIHLKDFSMIYEDYDLLERNMIKRLSKNTDELRYSIIRKRQKLMQEYYKPYSECELNKIIEDAKNNILWNELIKKSLWGRKIQDSMERFNKTISLLDYIDFVFVEEPTCFYHFYSDGSNKYNFISYPILQFDDCENLDHILYHENRHVVDTNEFTSGIDFCMLNYITELKTELNAFSDTKRMMKYELFRTNESFNSLYLELEKYTFNFFKDNIEFLNEVFFTGDTNRLFNMFGYENIINFERFLCDTAKIIETSSDNAQVSVRMEIGEQLVKRMK